LLIQILKSSYDVIKFSTAATELFFLSRDSPGVDKETGAPFSISFLFPHSCYNYFRNASGSQYCWM